MAEEKGKRYFTQDQMREIVSLLYQKEKADKSRQKTIRAKIRRMGLQWEELVGKKLNLTLDNLKKIIADGIIRVEGIEINNSPIIIKSFTESLENKSTKIEIAEKNHKLATVKGGRNGSDEYYVIDLCDEILGCKASRQHRFDFLKGDKGTRLPVDAYYPLLNLVVEYHESQHTKSTPFFDKKQTVSGVSRGEQRRIYDQLRRELLPKHGIKLVVISYTDFGQSKKLKRNPSFDKEKITAILTKEGVIK